MSADDSDVFNCVFVRPDLRESNLISIRYVPIESVIPPESVCIDFEGDTHQLERSEVDGEFVWEVNIGITPSEGSIAIYVDGDSLICNIDEVVYLGPITGGGKIKGALMFEFPCGLFCRKEDEPSEPIQFDLGVIPILEYKQVLEMEQQLMDLSSAQHVFDETKSRLEKSGIVLEELEALRLQYEGTMKENRKARFEFGKKSHLMEVASLQEHVEAQSAAALAQLTNPPPVIAEQDEPRNEEQLLRFRMLALNELKVIFPYTKEPTTLCGVAFPLSIQNSDQWNQKRAFLGFATHYIKEVSRVLGMALYLQLIPRSSSSMIASRLTDEVRKIPEDLSNQGKQSMERYEEWLIEATNFMVSSLMMDVSPCGTILDCLDLLHSIDEETLRVLIPYSSSTSPIKPLSPSSSPDR